MFTMQLTADQVSVLAEALTQYVDNNDPDECVDNHTTAAFAARLQLSHSLAIVMRDAVDAIFQNLAC